MRTVNGIHFVKGCDDRQDHLVLAGWPAPTTLVEFLDREIRLFQARLNRVRAHFVRKGSQVVIARGGLTDIRHSPPRNRTAKSLIRQVREDPDYEFVTDHCGLPPHVIETVSVDGDPGIRSNRFFALQPMQFCCVYPGCFRYRRPNVCLCAGCAMNRDRGANAPATYLQHLGDRVEILDRLSWDRGEDTRSTEEQTLDLAGAYTQDCFGSETTFTSEIYDSVFDYLMVVSKAREARSKPERLAALTIEAAALGYALIQAPASRESDLPPRRALDI